MEYPLKSCFIGRNETSRENLHRESSIYNINNEYHIYYISSSIDKLRVSNILFHFIISNL